MVKTTIRLPEALWRKARIRALDEGRTFQELVQRSLELYLKTPVERRKKEVER